MPLPPRAAVTAFRRRVAAGAFVAGAGQGLLVVGVLWAATLLAVRLSGGYLAPSWWWLWLAVPVVGAAIWRARGQRLTPAAAAAHLDRRLGLDGLLLCADQGLELDAGWQARLERGLAGLPAAMPRTRWRRILPYPALAAGLAVLTAMLPPPPEPVVARQLPTFQAEVGRLSGELRELFERGHVPEEIEQELRRKVAELQQKVDAGEMPEWRDFDDIDQRISREQLMQLAAAAKARNASDGKSAGDSKARSLESLAGAAKMLQKLGLLDDLPAQFAAALQAVQNPDGTFDLSKLPFDPAQLQALAEAFGDAFGDLQDLGALGLGEGDLADLQALVAGFGEGQGPGDGQGEGVGRGGTTRGPGHAALSLTESATGGADQAMPLPPGRGLPNEWVPVSSERITPIVAPVTNATPGAAGVEGTGGATWQLEYAPRHRAVLRKFFGKEGK